MHFPRRFGITTALQMRFSHTKHIHSPADLRNALTFAPFKHLPHEYEVDDQYYSPSPVTSTYYTPNRHWCFLGEIVEDYFFLRLRLNLRDAAGARVPVHFYTDDHGTSLAKRCRKGSTLAVLYANRHNFFDMSVGLRIEEYESVNVLPFSMEELLKANALVWVGVGSLEQKVKDRLCGGCGKTGNFRACIGCNSVFYCSTVSLLFLSVALCSMSVETWGLTIYSQECQTKDWKDGHKRTCKAIQALEWFRTKKWEKFEGDWFS